jgi:hypothetical protein
MNFVSFEKYKKQEFKKEAVVARQVKQFDQLPPTPGKQRKGFSPVPVPPPDWWAEELIPLD